MAEISCKWCRVSFSVRPSYITGRKFKFCSQKCYLLYRSSDEWIFWRHVLVLGDNECWPWEGCTNKQGYGVVAGNRYAHRVSWEIHKGPIPPAIKIRHKVCDNPSCVNPNHLATGSTQDNSDDMKKAGRSLVGVRNNKAKLDDAKVVEIVNLYIEGERSMVIAEKYGVNYSTIRRIVTGNGWNHLDLSL